MPKIKKKKPRAIRKARARRFLSQSAIRRVNRRRKPSSFEKKIHAILREEKIPFIPEKTIGRCHADLLIGKKHVVELNGCYWHGCQACYSKPTKVQKLAQARDGRRYYFFNKLGFDLTVIWGCDFKKHPEAVRETLRALYKN